jgi:hypothetical protein
MTTDSEQARNYLHHRHSDANNAILAAVGYSFRLLLKWLKILLYLLLVAVLILDETCTVALRAGAAQIGHRIKTGSSRTSNKARFN